MHCQPQSHLANTHCIETFHKKVINCKISPMFANSDNLGGVGHFGDKRDKEKSRLRQLIEGSQWDAQEGPMCLHQATHVLFGCKPLVAPIPTVTQSALKTSPTEIACTFPLCVQMCPHSVSIGVHPEVTSHNQCQQSHHTFQQDEIACCDLGTLPLLNGFNGPPTLCPQKSHTHMCATSFATQMQLGCPALDFPHHLALHLGTDKN